MSRRMSSPSTVLKTFSSGALIVCAGCWKQRLRIKYPLAAGPCATVTSNA